MFVRILCGNDAEFIINPDCSKHNFLLYLLEKMAEHELPIAPNEKLDFVDLNGIQCNVHKLGKLDIVGDALIDRETYVPLLLNMTEADEIFSVTVLLTTKNKIYDKIMNRLNMSRRQSKRGSTLSLSPRDAMSDRSKGHLNSRKGNTSNSFMSPKKRGKSP